MPSPITHIVLAEKVFDKHFSQKNKADFFVGTSLPDIRRFNNIDRDKTHFFGLKLEDIKKEDSFLAGFKFHSLTDEVHDRFFSYKDNPLFLEPVQIMATSLKALEDELLYDRLSNWLEVASYFRRTIKEENDLGLGKEDIATWHEALEAYLLETPSFKSRERFLKTMEFSDELADQIEAFVINMRKVPQIERTVMDFYNGFDDLIEKPIDF